MTADDDRYVEILVAPIRVCAAYQPKLGRGPKAGLSLTDFQSMYQRDPFYSWFGLDNPLMYAAHKAAGGMTSLYRQIGIGCERLFRQILQDRLRLSAEQSQWSYAITGANKKSRTLRLDGRIPLADVKDRSRRARIARWMGAAGGELKVDADVMRALRGTVFEVRQGYKSKDSKRQNADIANAATAYSQGYLPCVVLLSNQMDSDIYARYRSEQWVILTGRLDGAGNTSSTYAFANEVIGYDLAAFFERHASTFRAEVAKILEALLRTE
ncbi:MAG: hypothetical protein HY744_07915 [Deltaproteobacteria bacterium]|nr:hypothetical protein [Deltaproteobacteria bacterium]